MGPVLEFKFQNKLKINPGVKSFRVINNITVINIINGISYTCRFK